MIGWGDMDAIIHSKRLRFPLNQLNNWHRTYIVLQANVLKSKNLKISIVHVDGVPNWLN